ncbi:hypothetical protein Tco_1228221 [Tanacetum coccineum]
MRWCGCDDHVGVEEMGGAGQRLWCGGGGYRRETARGGGDRVDRVMGSVSELGRKNSPEKFFGLVAGKDGRGAAWGLAEFRGGKREMKVLNYFKKKIWNGYLRKGRKTKPKRQNRTRNGKAGKDKVKVQAQA